MVLRDVVAVALPSGSTPRAFGVVICSPRHSYLRRVLADQQHIAAINEATGDEFALFHLPVTEGRYRVSGGGPPGTVGMLFQQWIEPWENKAVLEELGIRSSEQPQMVVFHLDQHDQHDQIAIASLSLVDTSEEKARSRLLQACDTVRKSITAMIPETVSDEQAVFNVVARALGERRERDVFRRLWEIWSELKKLKP